MGTDPSGAGLGAAVFPMLAGLRNLTPQVNAALRRQIEWLERFGETSQDHQDFYVNPYGRWAKRLYYEKPTLGKIFAAPLVFLEAFLPSTRALFWGRQRLPIADAHYAMGFAFLHRLTGEKAYYDQSVHFLRVLIRTRCPGVKNYCWGYPFHWETVWGTFPSGTPIITTTPYCYEAFAEAHAIDGKQQWLEIMRSAADHALSDFRENETGPGAAASSYTPLDARRVVNSNVYRAAMLTHAAQVFSHEPYWQSAERNLNFVLQSQLPDGSWYYAMDPDRQGRFIDHFHTCFVLKGLLKIERFRDHAGLQEAIDRGLAYYLENLIGPDGLPRPFAKAPRVTIYKRELYDYAECINLLLMARNRGARFDAALRRVLEDLLARWQRPTGAFRTRQMLAGWNNVPMHRWGQSEMFRSLCLFLVSAKECDTMGKETAC